MKRFATVFCLGAIHCLSAVHAAEYSLDFSSATACDAESPVLRRAEMSVAVKCGSPLVVAAMRREGDRHVFAHLATLRPDMAAPDRKAEAERLTREAMRYLDAEIRARPQDWFWYNKRWILQPVKAPKD